MFRPKLTTNYRPRKIPSQDPSYTPFTKSHQKNSLPHTQPTTHHILSPSLLALDAPLLHITHGLYQAALAATRVTLYLYSILDTTSRSSPGCSRVSSRAQGLRRDYYSENSHILSYLFIAASIQYRLDRRP